MTKQGERIGVRVERRAREDARALAGSGEGEALALEMARVISELQANPYLGDPLERDLSGLRRVRFDTEQYLRDHPLPRFRVVYELLPEDGAPSEALIWAIGPRRFSDVYRRTRQRRR